MSLRWQLWASLVLDPSVSGDTERGSSWEAPSNVQSMAHRQGRERDLPYNLRLPKYQIDPSYLIPWQKLWSEQRTTLRDSPAVSQQSCLWAVSRASPFLLQVSICRGGFLHVVLWENILLHSFQTHAACRTLKPSFLRVSRIQSLNEYWASKPGGQILASDLGFVLRDGKRWRERFENWQIFAIFWNKRTNSTQKTQ